MRPSHHDAAHDDLRFDPKPDPYSNFYVFFSFLPIEYFPLQYASDLAEKILWHQMKVTKALLEPLLFSHFSPGGIGLEIPPIYWERPTSSETDSGLRSESGQSAALPSSLQKLFLSVLFFAKIIHPFSCLCQLTFTTE